MLLLLAKILLFTQNFLKISHKAAKSAKKNIVSQLCELCDFAWKIKFVVINSVLIYCQLSLYSSFFKF